MIGHYGEAATIMPQRTWTATVQDILTPFTGQDPNNDLSRLSQTAVDAAPSLVAQVRGFWRPGDLQGLVKREATLTSKLAAGGNAQQVARWEAELQLVRGQLDTLRGNLNAVEEQQIVVQQAPSNYAWIIASAGAIGTIALAAALALGAGRRRR